MVEVLEDRCDFFKKIDTPLYYESLIFYMMYLRFYYFLAKDDEKNCKDILEIISKKYKNTYSFYKEKRIETNIKNRLTLFTFANFKDLYYFLYRIKKRAK